MANNHQCVQNADSEKVPQVVDQEGCPDSSPSRALIPEASDFFPSVSLAVALLLIFISVLPMLSQPGMVFVSFRKLDNISRKEVHFHPLLYIQPPSTQLIIETLAKDREETITVLAVAKEHATQTLVCFSKNLFALLLKQGQGEPVTQQVMEVKTLQDLKNISNARALEVFSVSVTTKRKGHIPYCTILRPLNGNVHLMEITLSQHREVTMQRESSIIAHELLELMHKTGQVPETFVVKGSPRHRVKVIHVLGDPYLESGIVC
ncbi:uncharacterized protein [Eleutherodactylus coqui]|uniref:uncharacterized protein n=1 Tax=Eleutherodactylus coqui TaxID=57060 RepID=UPI0034621790